jgi:tight adherence protein B
MIGLALVIILVFALVGQAVWLVTDALNDRGQVETSVARRVQVYTDVTWDTAPPDASSVLRRKRFSRFPRLEALLRRLDLAESLSRDLRRAGMQMGAGEFLFIQLALTTAAGFGGFVLMPSVFGGLAPAVGAGLIGFGAPLLWLRRQRAKRMAQFEQALPDALDLVASSLRAGYSLADGLDLVARENEGPCGEEFRQVLEELSVGADMDGALTRLTERVVSEDTRLLATAIAVQRRTGGNLVDVLQQMARTLRERQRLRGEVRVLTTGPRVSGYIVGMMPVAMAAMMYVVSRPSFNMLVNEPIGRMALGFSAVMVVVGLSINRRIANVEM